MSRTTPVNQIPGTESSHSLLNRIFGLSQQVNGGIDFGTSTQTGATPSQEYTGNLDGQWANVTAPVTPNTEFAIPHTLGRVPSFYFYNTDRAAIVYQLPTTGTPWTEQNIYVKCSVASAVLRVFIT
jgi:hypothetical protein